MTPSERLEAELSAGLNDLAGTSTLDYRNDILRQVARTRQRPAWTFSERWLPMTVITRPGLAPPLRVVWLLLIGLLLVALTASVGVIGSRLLTSSDPADDRPATAMIPQGDEAIYAFASWVGGDSGQTSGDIYTVKADGTDQRQLTDGPGILSGPAWSPDGTRIAFRRLDGGSDTVEVMDAGGGNLRTLATNTGFISRDCQHREGLAWSPDGTSLIYPTGDSCMDAYGLSIVTADASSPTTRLLAPGIDSLSAAWSPDGTRIAYLASNSLDDVGLSIVETTPADALSGGLEGRVVAPGLGKASTEANSTWFSPPQWSPDGTEVAVEVGTATPLEETHTIFVIKADGSGRRVAVEDGGNPAWSPDGKQLAFHRQVDPSEYWNNRPCTVRTWIADADGSHERQLGLGDGCGYNLAWSPDGTRVATSLIASTPDETEPTWHLAFVMADGSTPPVLLPDATGAWQPVVAPLPPPPSFEPA
jgi:Tol biopolymer transport system component